MCRRLPVPFVTWCVPWPSMSRRWPSPPTSARVYHKPITTRPVFLLRRFEHGAMVYHVKSGIQSPLDLHGRRVGVRSYTLTPGVWMRGILQSAYGVNPQQVQWVLFGDEHVAEYVA